MSKRPQGFLPCSQEERTDHTGVVWDTKQQMLDYYEVNRGVYDSRIRNGWTKEKALTTSARSKSRGNNNTVTNAFTNNKSKKTTARKFIPEEERTDPLNRVWPSVSQMCKGWHVSEGTYYGRRKNGATIAEALGVSDITSCLEEVTDHHGTEFPNEAMMCQRWGTTVDVYNQLLAEGLSQAEALTGRRKSDNKPVTEVTYDHEGNKFESEEEMCKKWRVPFNIYRQRRRNGWDLEDALVTPVNWHAARQQTKEVSKFEDIDESKGQILEEAAALDEEIWESIEHQETVIDEAMKLTREQRPRIKLKTSKVPVEYQFNVPVPFKSESVPVKSNNSDSTFYAKVFRMKFIQRWALMRNVTKEDVSQHSTEVAMLTHALATIGNVYFDRDYDVNALTVQALFHDVTEVVTGDMPTPVKYANDDIRDSYKAVEKKAAEQLVNSLPLGMRYSYSFLLEEEHHLVKAADTLAAYLKCCDEVNAGNSEFTDAKDALWVKLMKQPWLEVIRFVELFGEAFKMNLDTLVK